MGSRINKLNEIKNENKSLKSSLNLEIIAGQALTTREVLKELIFELRQELPDRNVKEIVTNGSYGIEYIKFIEQTKSVVYAKSVKISLKHYLKYIGQQTSIRSIKLKQVEDFMIDLRRKVPKGYRVYYRTLKAAFNKAVDWGYIDVNYFKKVKLPKKQEVHPAYITREQLEMICEKLGDGNKVVKDFVITAFYSGCRRAELENLTWKSVDLSTRIITVGDSEFTTKSRNTRAIPICDELYEVLVKIKSGNKKETPSFILPLIKVEKSSQYVFCKSNGFKFTGDFFSRKFKEACRAAGMDEGIHLHSLRHSFASNLVQKGVNLYLIKELLGHSSIVVTEQYSHLNMDSLKEAIEKFNQPHLNPLLSAKADEVKERTYEEGN